MPSQLFVNNAKSTLAVAVSSNSQASLTVQTGAGALFPNPSAPNYFMVTLDDGTNVEVCKCVARAGDVLTVLRGQEGTTAQAAFATTATRVQLRLTAAGLDWINDTSIMMRSWVRPAANVNSWHVQGATLPTVVGSPQAATMTNSSWRESNARLRLTLGNSAQFPLNARVAQPTMSGQNGYTYYARFGFVTVPNTSHFYIGLQSTTGLVASVNPPSSLQNGVVVGYVGSGLNANLSLWRCNSGTPAVQLDLGSYFTVTTQAWYELMLAQQPNAARIDYRVRRLDISSIADAASYFTTSIPDNSLWLTPYLHGVALTTSALAVELGGWTWET
jgi:hypothetical protein